MANNFQQHRADYLYKIAELVSLPHLKTRYRIDASHIFQPINQQTANVHPSCPRCLLQHDESMFQYYVEPEAHQNLLQRYKRKDKLTRFQAKHVAKVKKSGQKFVIKCSTCARTTKIPIQKPAELEQFRRKKHVAVVSKTKTTKKKKKSRFAGIDETAVEQARSFNSRGTKQDEVIVIQDSPLRETNNSKCFASMEHATPAPTRKRMLEDVIVIEDSPLREKNKANASDIVPKTKKQKKLDVQALKQQMKDVAEARQALDVMATKQKKRKLKHKSKKLKDAISNIEHNSKPTNSLQDFLSIITV